MAMQTIPEPLSRAIDRLIDRVPQCVACGHETDTSRGLEGVFFQIARPVNMPHVDPMTGKTTAKDGVRALPTVCSGCHHVQLYAVPELWE